MEALSQGLKASLCIEDFLKTGEMRSAKKKQSYEDAPGAGGDRFHPCRPPCIGGTVFQRGGCRGSLPLHPVPMRRVHPPLRPDELLQKFPGRIAEEVQITVTPGTLDGDGTVATRLIATCSQCGLCGEVCPENIDMGDFLRAGHQAMHEKGAIPWAFHEFWLRDMAFANSSRASFSAPPPSGEKCTSVFFPGCQLGASDPRYVSESFRFLLGLEPGRGSPSAAAAPRSVGRGHGPVPEGLRTIAGKLAAGRLSPDDPCMPDLPGDVQPLSARNRLRPAVRRSRRGGTPVPGAGMERWSPSSTPVPPGTGKRHSRRCGPFFGKRASALPLFPTRAKSPSAAPRGQINIAAPKNSRWLAEKRSNDENIPISSIAPTAGMFFCRRGSLSAISWTSFSA